MCSFQASSQPYFHSPPWPPQARRPKDFHLGVVVGDTARIKSSGGNDCVCFGPMGLQTSWLNAVDTHAARRASRARRAS